PEWTLRGSPSSETVWVERKCSSSVGDRPHGNRAGRPESPGSGPDPAARGAQSQPAVKAVSPGTLHRPHGPWSTRAADGQPHPHRRPLAGAGDEHLDDEI